MEEELIRASPEPVKPPASFPSSLSLFLAASSARLFHFVRGVFVVFDLHRLYNQKMSIHEGSFSAFLHVSESVDIKERGG
jgi:hypothetical protein